MTQIFSVDSNNDLFLGVDGNISISQNLEAVLQACAHVVKVRLGEVILNTDTGIPYFEVVFNGVPNLTQFQAAARQAILQVPDVLEVVSFQTATTGTGTDTTLTYRAVIRTIYGEGEING